MFVSFGRDGMSLWWGKLTGIECDMGGGADVDVDGGVCRSWFE